MSVSVGDLEDPNFVFPDEAVLSPSPLFVEPARRWKQRYGVTTYLGNSVDPRFEVDLALVGSNDCKTGEYCGSYGFKDKTVGCLNIHRHHAQFVDDSVVHQQSIDGRCLPGQAVIIPHAFHCSDPLCPVCCRFWAGQMVSRALNRFEAFLRSCPGSDYQLVHSTVSVPECDFHLPFDDLHRKASSILQMVGVDGGNLLYHPKRWNKVHRCWYFSPHFHSVGVAISGRVDGVIVKAVHSHSGYVVKRIRVLSDPGDVKRVLMYQLSHAGVPSGSKHVVRWFGCLAYNQLSVPKTVPLEKSGCPLCGCAFQPVGYGRYVTVKGRSVFEYLPFPGSLAKHEGSVCLVDPGGWHTLEYPVKRRGKHAEFGEVDYVDQGISFLG